MSDSECDSDELLRILQGVEPDSDLDYETENSSTSEEDDNEVNCNH